MRRFFLVLTALVLHFCSSSNASQDGHLLPVGPFFDMPAPFGETYAKIVEQKLFAAPNWIVRYYEVLETPSATTALSIYRKDGDKYGLRLRQTRPELARSVKDILGRKGGLKLLLNTIRIERADCEMPMTTALELQGLWLAFLRQTRSENVTADKIYVTPPMVILYAKDKKGVVAAGKLPPDAWQQAEFLSLGKTVDSLLKSADASDKDRERLFGKIERDARKLRNSIEAGKSN